MIWMAVGLGVWLFLMLLIWAVMRTAADADKQRQFDAQDRDRLGM